VSENACPPELHQAPSAGEVVREVVGMGAPIIASMSSSTFMMFADFWMVSLLGKAQTAAMGPARITVFTVTAFLMGLARCTNTFAGQCFGRGERRECGPYTWQGLYVAVVAGALSFFLRPLVPVVFRLMGHPPELVALEVTYAGVTILMLGFVTANVTMASFFQAISRQRVPMFTSIVANAANIVMDYVLIFGKLGFRPQGMRGAAVATVLASMLETTLLLSVFLRKPTATEFGTRLWRWDWRRTKQFLHIGLPMGVSFMLDVASWTVFIGLVVSRFGEVQLAASNVTDQILQLSFMPAVGMGLATSALVAQYVGRGDVPGARRRVWMALKLTAAYMFTMGLVFFVFRRGLIGLFRPEPEVVTWGSRLLLLAALYQLLDAAGITMAGALRGAGDTRWPAAVGILYAWGLMLPLSYLLGHVLGYQVVGAWLAATLYVILYGVTMWQRFQRGRWERISIFAVREGQSVSAG
jgi:MATE family multidrug resistance protein